MARDATARLYDVVSDSVILDREKATITFRAKKGKLVDLEKLHESIWATRLSGRTGMKLHNLDVTAVGNVVDGENVVLRVAGSKRQFVLVEAGKSEKGRPTPFDRLREALASGRKVVSVTGRLELWEGPFPQLLAKVPKKPWRIAVKSFETGN